MKTIDFFEGRHFEKGINATFISLIPKEKRGDWGSVQLKDLRLVNLVGSTLQNYRKGFR